MDNINKDVNLKYSNYGDGKAIIEILNIGFEPLLAEEEYKMYKEIGLLKEKKYSLEKTISLAKSKLLYFDDSEIYYKWLSPILKTAICDLLKTKEQEENKTELFKKLMSENIFITRKIYDDRDFKNEDQFRDIIIFECDLTRSFGHTDMSHSDDIVSVVTYYTEIFQSIMQNGFDYKDKHFVFFTAGAGQTRCKKSTFVSEDKLDENFNKLFCGLTREEINRQDGMNTNKYLAYTSLCQTNSELWRDFNIDRAIVVEDIEYTISDQTVRYIYTESPEDKQTILELQNGLSNVVAELKRIKVEKDLNEVGKRRKKDEIQHEKLKKEEKKDIILQIAKIKEKYHKTSIGKRDITIPFTDGFGISLKKMPSSMFRLPFMKGLITYAPKRAFKELCTENKTKINKIVDIYEKSHSIDDIDYIFTRSQFKMHKYFNNVLDENGDVLKTGWEVYKDNFKKYMCDACLCNVEKKVKLNAKTNYQILQTLTTEMTDDEIHEIAAYDIENLNGIGNNIDCMLNVLGANTEKNNSLSYLQESLLLYPEMLKDFYIKTLLKNTKNSMINKFRSGKFNVNGSYTYAVPDVLACLQWWFNGERDIEKLGFVKEGNVCCELFENGEEVDCLRSPHLDHSHCIRINVVNEESKKWVKSKGVYIGIKDIMSKLLMYDNDGDQLLVHNNITIINCAKRYQEKYNMIPNYYDMPKASPQMLNNTTLFEGIVLAYHHGNIGTPSNEITKIFMTLNPNSKKEEIEEAIEVISLRVADVNYTIDFAKTLYKPTIPSDVSKRYKKYSGKKVPHFFMYAKKKPSSKVEEIGECNIDRIFNVVKSNRITFKNLLGKYSYKVLMSDPYVDKNSESAIKIVELYNSINTANLRKLSYIDFDIIEIDEKKKIQLQLEFDSKKQRRMFIDYTGESPKYIADVLVKSLQADINKDLLWRLFGDVLYGNIKRNIEGTKICEVCKERFEVKNKKDNSSKYCSKCKLEKDREKKRKWKNKHKISARSTN